jgi:Cu2+-exporting ATPase
MLSGASATSIASTAQQDSRPLHFARIGAASTILITTARYCCPPLNLVVVAALSYTTLPTLEKTASLLRSERRLDNQAYSSLIMIVLLGAGNYFAAALSTVIHHISEYVIEQSRKESARLASEVYHQAPEMVWIDDGAGVDRQIPLEQLKAGDLVLVTTGEVIPVDGVISSGMALIDQQALTGEANPVEMHPGDAVMAATILLSGRVAIVAQYSGRDSGVNRLNKLLHQTEEYKTQLQLKGEEWSNRIAFPVLAVSAMTIPVAGTASAFALLFSVPMDTVRSMLSMQTLVHMRRTSEQGAFIKDGRVLEELLHIDTILFDKTGTLTETRPEVAAIIPCAGLDEDTLLLYAAAAEQRSDHPIAQAITDKARQKKLRLPPVTDSRYDLGLGVAVTIYGHKILVGSQRFIQQQTETDFLPEEIQLAMEKAAGHSFVLIAIDNKIQGVLELFPHLRPEVPALMQSLKERGFKQLSIVSGDQQMPTQRLADRLSMDRVYAEVEPNDKAQIIRQLQAEGRHVCFVGDGINDAIALKQANVSICLQSASVIANEMAQIILVNDSLEALDDLFGIAAGLHKKLGDSLKFWIGFGATNALAVPLLGFGPLQSSMFYTVAYAGGMIKASNAGMIQTLKPKSIK